MIPPAQPELSIVIPAFNEVARLQESLRQICRFLDAANITAEIRVVDDGSADATSEIVLRNAENDSRIVLQKEPHRGKGGAVRAGMLTSRARLRLLCDADLSVPMAELPKLLGCLQSGADIAIGCRESPGANRVGEPQRRHLMGRAFNGVVRQLARVPFPDTQCGFKLFTAAAAEAVFQRLTIDGWAFDVEALVLAEHCRYRVDVVPVTWIYSADSRISPIRDALHMARDVAYVRYKIRRGDYRRIS